MVASADSRSRKGALPGITAGSNVEGIPIAAKFKGPGPVYSLPPTLGPASKYPGQRAPIYSFGVKIPLRTNSIGPGPAAFAPQFGRNGPKFSLQGGFKKARKNGRAVIIGKYESDLATEVDLDNPGPANYNIMHINNGHRPPAYTITGRCSNDKANATPGPAAYLPPPYIGTRQVIGDASAAPTIAPLRHLTKEITSPGPAAYQAINPARTKQSAPAYSLGKRWDEDSSQGEGVGGGGRSSKMTPGPGAYNPMGNIRASAPKYSFRQRHSEYEHFMADEQNDGPFII